MIFKDNSTGDILEVLNEKYRLVKQGPKKVRTDTEWRSLVGGNTLAHFEQYINPRTGKKEYTPLSISAYTKLCKQ